jgi:hypothetical protein
LNLSELACDGAVMYLERKARMLEERSRHVTYIDHRLNSCPIPGGVFGGKAGATDGAA